MNVLEEIFENKEISNSSKKLYVANLKRLNNNEIPKNFNFLNNLEQIQ